MPSRRVERSASWDRRARRHRSVAPAQGVHQARHPLPPGARPCAAELGRRARARL